METSPFFNLTKADSPLLNFFTSYGFTSEDYTYKSFVNEGYSKEVARCKSMASHNYRLIQNISIVLSWFPLIGIIVGIGRIIFNSVIIAYLNHVSPIPENEKHRIVWVGALVRGIGETLSLGLVLMPIDLVITVHRCLKRVHTTT